LALVVAQAIFQLMGDGPLHDLQARFAAEQRIVAAVHQSEPPNGDDVRIWLRGGAVFWNEDHWFVAWGLLLPQAIAEDEIKGIIGSGIRTAIEESDDAARQKFGNIPLRGAAGNEAVAVTAFDGFLGDKLFGFYPSVDDFVTRAPIHGWLLGQERDLSDALARMSDAELTAIWSHNAEQPFR